MKTTLRERLLFIIPSAAGIMLFMIPVKYNGAWTVTVKILADAIASVIGGILPLLCLVILTVSAILSLVALAKPAFIMNNAMLRDTFATTPVWTIIRTLGAVFCWITYLGIEGIPEKYISNLELKEILEKVASRLMK